MPCSLHHQINNSSRQRTRFDPFLFIRACFANDPRPSRKPCRVSANPEAGLTGVSEWPIRKGGNLSFPARQKAFYFKEGLRGTPPCTGLQKGPAVISRHPRCPILGQFSRVFPQLRGVVEGIGVVQFAGLIEAHVKVAHLRPLRVSESHNFGTFHRRALSCGDVELRPGSAAPSAAKLEFAAAAATSAPAPAVWKNRRRLILSFRTICSGKGERLGSHHRDHRDHREKHCCIREWGLWSGNSLAEIHLCVSSP